MIIDPWPLVILGLRIAAVGLLYLFLFSAFRALRGELNASRSPAIDHIEAPAPPVAAPPAPVPVGVDEEPERWEEPEREPAPIPRRPARPRTAVRRRRRAIPARVAIPSVAALLVLVLGAGAMVAGGDALREQIGAPPASGDSDEPFGPPTVEPEPGRVTVGLAALQDARLRITVDGTVEFEGVLRAGERQLWEGGERIQVWTDSGKTTLLSVNGQNLGPYSPAMGHPDWNRIDFGFWPGWAQ